MDTRTPLSACFYLGILSLVVSSSQYIVEPRSSAVVDAVLNMYCGVAEAPADEDDPLRFSPWMVVLTAISAKGKDTVVNCGATLISGKHAITSEACLRREKTKPINAVFGAPSLNELNMGTKRPIEKFSVLLSDDRIAVLHFGFIIFSLDISPICLERGDLAGVYATVGYNGKYKNKNQRNIGKKIAFLKMQEYCQINGFCAEVLPVEVFPFNVYLRGHPTEWRRFLIEQERNIRLLRSLHERCKDFCEIEEPWEMEATEIQEGAPLLIRKDSYWYIKGIMMKKIIDQDEDTEYSNGELETEDKNSKEDKKDANKKATKLKKKHPKKDKNNGSDEVPKKDKNNGSDEVKNIKEEKNKSEGTQDNSVENTEVKKEDNSENVTTDNKNNSTEVGIEKTENDDSKVISADNENKSQEVAEEKKYNADTEVTTANNENVEKEDSVAENNNDDKDETEEVTGQKRRKKRDEQKGRGKKHYDLYFVKMTSNVVDELKNMFSIFN